MGFPVILMGLALIVFLVGGFLAPDLDGLGIAFIAYGMLLNH